MLLNTCSAKERWQSALPKLNTLEDLRQAHIDAPYWEEALRMKIMPPMDDVDSIDVFHLSRIYHKGFWDALVGNLEIKNDDFLIGLYTVAIQAGNNHALDALGTLNTLPLKDLLVKCMTSAVSKQMHPRSILWFAQDPDPVLQIFLGLFSESALEGDYANAMLTGVVPFWWDAPNGCSGADAIRSTTKEWCSLPTHFVGTKECFETVLKIFESFNKCDLDLENKDRGQVKRSKQDAVSIRNALNERVDILCSHAQLSIGLIRTLTGRMTTEDLDNPYLCAAAEFQALMDGMLDWYCILQNRALLKPEHYVQIKTNATQTEPLPTLLNLMTRSGIPFDIYSIIEPYLNNLPVIALDMPQDIESTFD